MSITVFSSTTPFGKCFIYCKGENTGSQVPFKSHSKTFNVKLLNFPDFGMPFTKKTPIFQFRPVAIIPLDDIFHDFLSYMDLLLQSINALNYPKSRIKALFVRNFTKLFHRKFNITTTTLGYKVAKFMRASAI